MFIPLIECSISIWLLALAQVWLWLSALASASGRLGEGISFVGSVTIDCMVPVHSVQCAQGAAHAMCLSD